MRIKRTMKLLNSIAVAALGLSSLTSAALATTYSTTITKVEWQGPDSFNDAEFLFSTKIRANELIDITGSGLYEGCCTPGKPTNFTLQILVGSDWRTILTWTTKYDEDTKSLDNLVPKVIKLGNDPVIISGIRLTSDPDGVVEKRTKGPDFNFTDFIGVMSKHDFFEKNRWKYRDWKDFEGCEDYDNYVRKVTKFVFECKYCSDDPTGQTGVTPLPAALPLMGSVLGGFGIAMWRRRRKQKTI